MAEYNEVIKQFKRMCWYYSRDKGQKSCPMCTSYPNCNIGQCRKIAFEKPAHFAATVMRWAAEHPEPVYPSWLEYIMDVQHDCVAAYNGGNDTLWKWMWTTPIPADIAQKLGVEPKEESRGT